MLQDLDTRQTAANEAANLYAKPVARREARLRVPLIAGAAAGVVALAVAGTLGWHYWHKPQVMQAAHKPVKVVMLPTATATAPVVQAAPVPQPELARVAEGPAKAPEPVVHEARHAKAVKVEDGAARAQRARPKADRESAAKPPAVAHVAANTVTSAPETGKEVSPLQKAESSYRRALASLQDGYVNDAIASFEDALKANPKHDAARQTLVSLLIENRRVDDAIGQLQLGLTLDPRQPSMAMLLARLQIERGASGIDTLMRTLPYAGSNADYHAFLAGALQRQQRHREAAEQYQAALQGAPQNGVWWMGLGMSLQADKRDAEALDAYRKAKGTGTLSPELLNFVDRKILQLGR